MAKNKLTSMQGLENLTNLNVLALQANFIESLDGLQTLTQLDQLYL